MRRRSARRDERAVAAVIAEILLVAMSVAISGVVYFTASSFALQASSPAKPFVALMPATVQDGGATITVAGATWASPSTSYKVNLMAGGVLGRAVPLAAAGSAASLPIQGVSYEVLWSDAGNGGALVGGDTISVRGANGALPSDTAFTFYLLWSDGSVLQSVSWTT